MARSSGTQALTFITYKSDKQAVKPNGRDWESCLIVFHLHEEIKQKLKIPIRALQETTT